MIYREASLDSFGPYSYSSKNAPLTLFDQKNILVEFERINSQNSLEDVLFNKILYFLKLCSYLKNVLYDTKNIFS